MAALLTNALARPDFVAYSVERMHDAYGNTYIAMPQTDVTAIEYYTQLQAEADQGHRPGLLDPADVALTYLDEVWDFAPHIADTRLTYVEAP